MPKNSTLTRFAPFGRIFLIILGAALIVHLLARVIYIGITTGFRFTELVCTGATIVTFTPSVNGEVLYDTSYNENCTVVRNNILAFPADPSAIFAYHVVAIIALIIAFLVFQCFKAMVYIIEMIIETKSHREEIRDLLWKLYIDMPEAEDTLYAENIRSAVNVHPKTSRHAARRIRTRYASR